MGHKTPQHRAGGATITLPPATPLPAPAALTGWATSSTPSSWSERTTDSLADHGVRPPAEAEDVATLTPGATEFRFPKVDVRVLRPIAAMGDYLRIPARCLPAPVRVRRSLPFATWSRPWRSPRSPPRCGVLPHWVRG